MSQLQPLPHLQPQAECRVDAHEVQFWLQKAMTWGQADSLETQRDTCLNLGRLKEFLQLLLSHIDDMSSTTEALMRLPFLGQLLGRLCWNPYITADAVSCRLLFQGLCSLYSEEPSNAVERKANAWIRGHRSFITSGVTIRRRDESCSASRCSLVAGVENLNVLCQLTTEEDNGTEIFMRHMDVAPKQYHLKVLKKRVELLSEEMGKICSCSGNPSRRCSCDGILAASETCVPLVTCPEVAPLIGALLQRPVTCGRAKLSPDFLVAVSSAYSRGFLPLDEQALISLWSHSLPSLEVAVMSLLEPVLTNPSAVSHIMEKQLAKSIMPKACAQHWSMFLVVNDIFRSVLKQVEGNHGVLTLLQSFTRCFLREVSLLLTQVNPVSLNLKKCVSLKTFFPNTPQHLLLPLLTQPTEMPPKPRRDHLTWLIESLRRLTEEEEEGDANTGARGPHAVFEAWFLLAQCAHWVEFAVRSLVSAPPEDCNPLLWLLTFYHHPTNRGHHRTLQLVRAKEAWAHVSFLFLSSALPVPASRLQALVELRSNKAQHLVLTILVNAAAHSRSPLSTATKILRTVVCGSASLGAALCVLSSAALELSGGGSSPSDANRVQLRIKALQDALAQASTDPR